MAIEIEECGIDIGLVTDNAAPALEFYGNVLGLEKVGEMDMPGGMHMHRFACGASVLKVVVLKREARAIAPPGGIGGARGIRYFTIHVADLAAVVATCEAAGAKVAVPVTELAPGRNIAIVEDPDGNWVEFLQESD